MKKIFWTILAIILVLFVVIFSLQNKVTVGVRILSREFDTSLAWVVFVAFVFGILTGFLILLPKIIGLKLRLRKCNKRIKSFEKTKVLSVDEDKTE